MKNFRIGMQVFAWLVVAVGCAGNKPKPWGQEQPTFLPGSHKQVWAIAPAINISGQGQIDPLLQADLVYQEMQQIHGLTAIPVDRVVEVYASLRINRVESEQQAVEVCQLLGCDGLMVPTVTAYDPYDPPKFGASLQLFVKPGTFNRLPPLDPRLLERSPTAVALPTMPLPKNLAQVVEMFDDSIGSVRDRVAAYSAGRTDPNGPMGPTEITMSMDRYCAFGYHELLSELIGDLAQANPG